jgi:hypothetical protein
VWHRRVGFRGAYADEIRNVAARSDRGNHALISVGLRPATKLANYTFSSGNVLSVVSSTDSYVYQRGWIAHIAPSIDESCRPVKTRKIAKLTNREANGLTTGDLNASCGGARFSTMFTFWR